MREHACLIPYDSSAAATSGNQRRQATIKNCHAVRGKSCHPYTIKITQPTHNASRNVHCSAIRISNFAVRISRLASLVHQYANLHIKLSVRFWLFVRICCPPRLSHCMPVATSFCERSRACACNQERMCWLTGSAHLRRAVDDCRCRQRRRQRRRRRRCETTWLGVCVALVLNRIS